MPFNREALTLRTNRDGRPLRLPERALLSICRPVNAPPLPVATTTYTPDNALDFARRMIPDFDKRIRGRRVLDFACGHGYQAIAMARAGAKEVFGLDIVPALLEHGRALAAKTGVNNVTFGTATDGKPFDVVVSLGAIEHFADPAAELRRMLSLTGDEVLVAFAEPWFSPYGTHLGGTTRMPWLNLVFSEKTLINVRNLYPDGVDGATCFAEISGGLNKMTVRRFENILASLDGIEVEVLRLIGVKGFHFATRLPLIREMMTGAITCVLHKKPKA